MFKQSLLRSAKQAPIDQAETWLRQFAESDRIHVRSWLSNLQLIDAEKFRTEMTAHIREHAAKVSPENPIVLYVERELKCMHGKPQYAFHQKISKRPPRFRAIGKASKIKLLQPLRTVLPEVGSEGILANLVTQLMRSDRTRYLVNVGPDLLRENQVHSAFIICDFIGTGARIKRFLDSFWQIATVKSWSSLKLFKFHILAYSGTKEGIAAVRNHRSNPEVHWVAPCPTLDTEFPDLQARVLREIFVKYDPVDHDPIESLGYRGQGTMLVFAHGCPNNSPRLLYKRSRKWRPLFAERSNTLDRLDTLDAEQRRHAKFERLAPTSSGRLKNAALSWGGIDRLLVLTALKAGFRFNEDIAHAAGLEVQTVEASLKALRHLGWISSDNRLTSTGRQNLALASPLQIRSKQKFSGAIGSLVYYPKSLRPPFKS